MTKCGKFENYEAKYANFDDKIRKNMNDE